MKNILSYMTIGVLLATCKPKGDEFVPSKASGVVFYSDTILKSPKTFATDADVYIATNVEADPFITKYKTDKEGVFNIDFVPRRDNLCLVAEWKDNRDILFKGNEKLPWASAGEDLILYPRYPKGKLKVIVQDANSQPVNGADVYLFVNQAFANTISESEVKGHIQKITTNENGIAFFYNLEVNDYRIAAKRDKQFSDNTLCKINDKNVTDYKEVLGQTLKINSAPTAPSFLEVEVTDGVSPMFGAEVFLFSSEKQAQTIEQFKKPNTAISYKTTDGKGIAAFTGLTDNTVYYAAVRDTLIINGDKKAKFGYGKGTSKTPKGDPIKIKM